MIKTNLPWFVIRYDFYPTRWVFFIPSSRLGDRKYTTRWIKIISNHKPWEILNLIISSSKYSHSVLLLKIMLMFVLLSCKQITHIVFWTDMINFIDGDIKYKLCAKNTYVIACDFFADLYPSGPPPDHFWDRKATDLQFEGTWFDPITP